MYFCLWNNCRVIKKKYLFNEEKKNSLYIFICKRLFVFIFILILFKASKKFKNIIILFNKYNFIIDVFVSLVNTPNVIILISPILTITIFSWFIIKILKYIFSVIVFLPFEFWTFPMLFIFIIIFFIILLYSLLSEFDSEKIKLPLSAKKNKDFFWKIKDVFKFIFESDDSLKVLLLW